MNSSCFVEVDGCQLQKNDMKTCGDFFLTKRISEENRIISVLADGLGSGVKANILSTLTGTMALHCMSQNMPIHAVAESILSTLPVCSERKIAYSTFTIADVDSERRLNIVEHENPPYLFFSGQELQNPEKRQIPLKKQHKHPVSHSNQLQASYINTRIGDRLVIFSDGVTQAGAGSSANPLGWGQENIATFISRIISNNRDISARQLARRIVWQAASFDQQKPGDDITCLVMYFRQPRHLLLVSGPPMHPDSDKALAEIVRCAPGKKIIAGGTTAKILGRELNLPIVPDLTELDPIVPPPSKMPGIDLVSEGMLTLETATEMLTKGNWNTVGRNNAAARLAELLVDSDIIQFIVGTRVNNAHQDPINPVQMDIRTNVIRRLSNILQQKYTKQTHTRLL